MTSSATHLRVFVVEDHDVMRQLLCEALEREPDLLLCGSASSAERAVSEVPASGANLVLVDVSLPAMSGLELVRTLRADTPGLQCLMVSGHIEAAYAVQALESGACGYVLKGRPQDLRAAIQACRDGVVYLSEPLREKIDELAK
jgi:DNA-binding NarL/FixJ family response regulator